LGAKILRRDRLLPNGGCKGEQGAKYLHGVDVVLPNMEPFRAQFDRQGSVERLFIV
jgi:hypothetical protein